MTDNTQNETFECGICTFERPLNHKITLSCETRHELCSDCFTQLPQLVCPYCRNEIGYFRRPIENVADSQPVVVQTESESRDVPLHRMRHLCEETTDFLKIFESLIKTATYLAVIGFLVYICIFLEAIKLKFLVKGPLG